MLILIKYCAEHLFIYKHDADIWSAKYADHSNIIPFHSSIASSHLPKKLSAAELIWKTNDLIHSDRVRNNNSRVARWRGINKYYLRLRQDDFCRDCSEIGNVSEQQ